MTAVITPNKGVLRQNFHMVMDNTTDSYLFEGLFARGFVSAEYWDRFHVPLRMSVRRYS